MTTNDDQQTTRADGAPDERVFRRVLRLFRPYRRALTIGVVLLLLAAPIQMAPPLVWKFVVDDAIPNEDVGLVLALAALMCGIHWTGAALSAARTYILGATGQRFMADLRAQLHARLMAQSVQYHHDQRTGDQVARVMGDVDTLNDVVIDGVDQTITQAVSFFWVAAILLWLDVTVGLLTLLPLMGVAFATYFFNVRVKDLYKRIRDRYGDLSARLQEQLSGVSVVKAFAREDHERARFSAWNQILLGEAIRGVGARAAYFPSVTAIGYLSNGMMLAAGGYFVIQGTFSLGDLIAYRGYWWFLFFPIFTLAQTNELFQRAGAACRRIFAVLDAPMAVTDRAGARVLETPQGHVRFEGVSFQYREGVPVLEAIDFDAAPGQHIGIVGPSGAGKSTVLHLALRFYDPVGGRVQLDGHDLRDLQEKSVRRPMALVSQEPFLFGGTIRENIVFGQLEATDEAVVAAAERANAHPFIDALPEGYDTRVGERGVKLSGGQKQRISIARAFLANPKVLLLDEATASVEPESEAVITAALERLMEGRTTITVSHRLSLVRGCDEILVIDNGHIAERGTHEALLERGGWYARMYTLQTQHAPLEA